MDDPHYLEAMMHGEYQNKKKENEAPKGHLDVELENEIDKYVDGLEFEDNKDHHALESPQAKKEKIKLEIKEAVKLPELSKNLESALNILFSEGSTYLSPEAYEILLSDFTNGSKLVANIKLSETENAYLQDITKFTDETMTSIATIAIAKFVEGKHEDSLSLFSLLTVLNPGYAEYWLRLGIAAQKCSNYELASRAYATASELDPDIIEARLFATECYVNLKDLDKAKNEIAEAKKITERINVDKKLIDLIPIFENTIKK